MQPVPGQTQLHRLPSMNVPQRIHKVKALLATGRDLQIQFYGLPRRPRQPASVYTYRGLKMGHGTLWDYQHPELCNHPLCEGVAT